ncbi:alpha/beta fold hydrolase [Gallaecimonas xiamenensis]|uniref:Alpha/beta hydrolase fold protein n=1 Tax=Gallaecimonas xiamenensis 3-C-1 TaxID=745411 RepID=K2K8V7_9GAMM|nr:alpha/beta hydrolase [Gallaecimonas xiamenensis]EKE73700.1 alpha/beta hydrolase fold protein [Gallaecimonas xiamenensis 3-C-1]
MKPTLIFLPGLFAGGWIWDQVAEACRAQGYQTKVMEEAIPQMLGGSLDEAHEALDQLVARETAVVLVGNSMGGLIAMDYGRRKPAKVSALVLSGSPGLAEMDAGVTLMDLRRGCTQAASSLAERVFYDPSLVPDRGVEDIRTVFSQPRSFKNIVQWLTLSRQYDAGSTLGAVPCPVQLVWGDHDRITPGQPWQHLAKGHSHLDYQEVACCGHSPMLEKPGAFLAAMAPALELSHLSAAI